MIESWIGEVKRWYLAFSSSHCTLWFRSYYWVISMVLNSANPCCQQ